MSLVLCNDVDWDNIPDQDEVSFQHYCNEMWHDNKLIHICADYTDHANAHECECGERK